MSSARRTAIALILVLSIAVAMLAGYAWSYFFLLDDFMVAREASRTVGDLASSPVYNFYRPAGYLWGKTLFELFGWDRPAGHSALTMVVHAACAALVAAVARLSGLQKETAALAGALFFLSPWGTEPFLYLSGGFDLVATAGLLVCMAAGLTVLSHASFHWATVAAGITGAAIAVFGKETGLLAAALFVFAGVCLHGPRALFEKRAVLYLVLLLATAAIYLVIRERLLPGLDGGYGDFSALVTRAPIAANVWAFVRALMVPPLPDVFSPGATPIVRILGNLYTLACVALVCVVVVSRWRLALFCVTAVLMSIAPVMWVSLAAGSTAGSRLLYLPGVWLSVLIAAGLGRLRGPGRAIAASILLGVGLISLYAQVRVWRESCRLSRSTISQLAPYAGSPQPLFITNLASLSADGPYVMNALSITSYFGPSFPRVDANLMAIKFDRGLPGFSFWMTPPREARPEERAVTLDLPIWMAVSRPAGEIDAPLPGAVVTQPFPVTGWTIDAGARDGSGVDLVNVYAHALPGTEHDATLLGKAAYGEPRADVAKRFGAQFANSGFRLEVSGLRPGSYRIVVRTRRPLARGADRELSVDVVVR